MSGFTSFDAFLETCPEPIARQYQQVRSLVQRLIPQAREEIKYRTPFVTFHGIFLYFSFHKKKHWVLGFCNGHLLEDEARILRADEGQTMIRHWVLEEAQKPDLDLLGAYLLESAGIQLQLKEARKRKKGKPKTTGRV